MLLPTGLVRWASVMVVVVVVRACGEERGEDFLSAGRRLGRWVERWEEGQEFVG